MVCSPSAEDTESSRIDGMSLCEQQIPLFPVLMSHKHVATGTKQADVFRSTHQYFHVLAHQDDLLSWECLSLQAQLNCICNAQAKAAVCHGAMASPRTGHQILPFKAAAVFVGGIKSKLLMSAPICGSRWEELGPESGTTNTRFFTQQFST